LPPRRHPYLQITLEEAITTPEFTARYFHGARITVADGEYRSLGPDDSVWGDESGRLAIAEVGTMLRAYVRK
jgi:hypothetical protein